MRRLAAVTFVALLAGCGIPRLARQPGSDVAQPERGPRKVTTTRGPCRAGGNGVTGATVGGDRVTVSTCRSVSSDTAPDASLDGRTPRPPVP